MLPRRVCRRDLLATLGSVAVVGCVGERADETPTDDPGITVRTGTATESDCAVTGPSDDPVTQTALRDYRRLYRQLDAEGLGLTYEPETDEWYDGRPYTLLRNGMFREAREEFRAGKERARATKRGFADLRAFAEQCQPTQWEVIARNCREGERAAAYFEDAAEDLIDACEVYLEQGVAYGESPEASELESNAREKIRNGFETKPVGPWELETGVETTSSNGDE